METNLTHMKKVINAFSDLRIVTSAKLLILLFTLVTATATLKAQPIAITLGQVSGCPNTDILIPVYVENFNNISAISLKFNYDTSMMSPIRCNVPGMGSLLCNQDANATFTGQTFFTNEVDGLVIIGGFSITGFNIGNGLMVNLRFHLKNHSAFTNLTWIPDAAAFADINGDNVPATWIDGTAYTTPSCSLQPVNASVIPGANATFTVTGVAVTTYQWQESVAGGSFTNLTNNPPYSGATSNSLTITGATNGMSGNQYRCHIVGDGTCAAYNEANSNAVTLTVSVPCPTAFAIGGGGNYCVGSSGSVITLPNSELGVTYQLLKGGVPVAGTTVAGTGSAIAFPAQTALGTYSVTGTNTCGTTTMTGTTTIGTWSLPSGTISGSTQICPGGAAQLNFNLSGGNKPYSIVYTDGVSNFTSNTNQNFIQITVFPVTPTTYTLVSIQDLHCTGTVSGSAAITFKTAPEISIANTSSNPLCTGGTITLTASGNGTTYNWSGPNGFLLFNSPVVSIPNATTANTGTYIATTTGSNGCTGTASQVINVFPPVPDPAGPITGIGSVCQGQTGVTYSVGNIANATSYVWSVPTGATIASGNGTSTITVDYSNSAVSGQVSVYGNNGCGAGTSNSTTVTVNAKPNAQATNNGPICSGATLNLNASGGTSYAWTGPNGFTASGASASVANAQVAASGTYTVVVTNTATGCQSSATTVATVNQGVTATATNNGPKCAGQTIQLTATGGTNYNWSGPNGFTSNISNPVINNATNSGVYSVTVSSNGCSDVKTTNVVVNPIPNVTASNNGPVCQGSSVTLNANGAITYSWSGPNGFTSSIQSPTTTVAGTYTVIGTSNGCSGSGNTVVVINAKPVANAGTNQTITTGNSTTLAGSAVGGSGVYTYSWTPAAQLVNPNIANPTTVVLTSTTIFTLVVTDNQTGCVSSGSNVTVTVNNTPLVVDVTANPTSICPGATVNLSAVASGGSGNYAYSWTSNPAGFTSSLANPTVNPTVSTVYSCLVTSGVATTSGSATVTVNPLPTVFNVSGGGTYCQNGNGLTITLSGSETGVTYKVLRNGSLYHSTTGTGSPLTLGPWTEAGNYTISAQSSYGCTANMSGNASILISPLPTIFNGSLGSYVCGNPGGYHILLGGSEVGVQYQLFKNGNLFGSSVAGTGSSLDFGLITETGTYTCTGTLINSPYCTNNMSLNLVIENVYSLPIVFNITGGGSACQGNGVGIGLDGSETGVNYQLFHNGNPVSGNMVAGTNLAISFGQITQSGNYTVVATHVLSGCTSNQSGSVNVTINQNPIANAGPDQTVNYGTSATLSGSVGAAKSGNTYLFHWEPANMLATPANISNPTTVPLTTATTFTLVVTNSSTGCVSQADQVTINITGGPLAISASATPGTICSGAPVQLNVNILNGTGNNTISWTSDPAGFQSSLQNPVVNPTVSTTYYVSVDDGSTIQTANVSVVVHPYPALFDVTGGGTFCQGENGVTVGLSGSEAGNIYTLFKNNVTTGVSQTGTGSPLQFNNITDAGSYNIKSSTSFGCQSVMNGTVLVNSTALPHIVVNPSNVAVLEGGDGSFEIIATNTTTFQWQLSTDNGNSWNDITDDAVYSGSQTSVLDITGATLDMDNYTFRVILHNGICSTVSNQASLSVLPVGAQIITNIGAYTSCPGTLIVPVTVQNFANVNAISSMLLYNPAVLTFVGTQNLNPELISSQFTANAYNGAIGVSYFSLNTLNLGNALLYEMVFTYNGGSCNLDWDLTTPDVCQYSDINAMPLAAIFNNGSVSALASAPVITDQPVDASVMTGDPVSFHVIASGTPGFAWQISTNGGNNWVNLTENADFNGVNTPDLSIPASNYTMNGNMFRCVVTEPVCGLTTISESATLTVNQVVLEITTTAGSVSACPGSQVVVPVTFNNVFDISAISLTLGYDPSVLTYTGFENLNPAFNPVDISIFGDPGQWKLSWFNLTPVNIASGNLLDLVFTYNGGNTNLTWDVITSGNCEYDDVNAVIVPSVFVDGSVSGFVVPAISSQPANAVVFDGDNAIFGVVANDATSYSWEVSNNGVTWSPLSDGGIYTGTQTSQLALTGVQLSLNGNQYRCVVSNTNCTATTTAATLTVNQVLQDIITTIGSANACPGEQIIVPVSVQHVYDISAISLTLGYDPSVLTYTGYQDLNPVFNSSDVTIFGNPGLWQLSWFNLTPITISNDLLLNLAFTYHGGNTNLTWDVVTPGNCEYDDYNAIAIPANFTNGSVNSSGVIPTITYQPSDATVFDGDNATFAVTATDVTTYVWQVKESGSDWSTILDGGIYSGASTSTLAITGAGIGMNGYQYRCVLNGEVCNITSNAATLTVNPVLQEIITTAGNVTACIDQQVIVPVNVQYLYDVAAISLSLNYDPSVLTYNGYENLNSAFNPTDVTIFGDPGQWKMSWFNLTPVNVGSGTLLNLVFTYHGGTSDLTWDVTTSGNCEYDDFNAQAMPSTFVNGSVNINPIAPSITSQPADQSVLDGENASFIVNVVNAETYQWQVNTSGTWVNVIDGGMYNGAQSTELFLTGVSLSMNNYQYRCLVSGNGCSSITNYATLYVSHAGSMIITTLPNIENCSGTEVLVPVHGQYLYDVSAISLSMNYDPTVLSYNGYSNLNPVLNTGDINIFETPGNWRMSWFSLMPINLLGGDLLDLNFTYLGGSSALTWDLGSGNSEYNDFDGNILPASFVNGSVNPLASAPVITQQPSDITIAHHGNALFSVMATNANGYQWQISTNGGLSWTNLTDGGMYSGTQSSELILTNVIYLNNGNEYRCQVLGTECNTNSNSALLTVLPEAFTIVTTVNNVAACPGSDIVVPITVTDFYNVASASLTLDYNTSVLDYLGYQNLNPGLADALVSPTPGQFKFSWYSITPASIGDATLIELLFHYNGGTADLNWDLVTSGNTEYTDYNAQTMSASFVSGTVTSSLLTPTIDADPVNFTEFVGSPASFTVSATNAVTYQWQISNDNGLTWMDIAEGGLFSNTNSSTLNISAISIDQNGMLFRAVVGGTCSEIAISQPAMLTVILQPTIITTAGSVEGCAGTFIVPVNVEELNNIASISLTLNYNDAVLTYLGYQNENSALNTGFLSVNAVGSQVRIGFFTIDPIFVGNDHLIDLVFSSTGGYSDLTWETTVPGSCEYKNLIDVTIPSSYVNGSVTAYALPEVSIVAPSEICENGGTINLAGYPEGGEFSGEGVTATSFDPTSVGVGTWTISYTYTSEYGCVNTATHDIQVNPAPLVTLEPLQNVCVNGSVVTLNGLPEGGNYSGTGVVDGTFDPQVAGVGTWTITYDYTNEFGCSNSTSQTITVLPIPTITLNPTSTILDEGGNTSFHVEALNATNYIWQVSSDNGITWNDLAEDQVYAGVNTPDLSISGVSLNMNDNLYHCVVSGLCSPDAVSEAAVLTVNPIIVTIAGTATQCIGEVVIPINVEHFYGVASLSLSMAYDNSILSYMGYEDVNTELNSGFLSVNATSGLVKIGYFSVTPANIGDGLLMNIRFGTVSGYSDLTWDNLTPGNCEYQNLNSEVITSVFVNGSATIHPLPLVSIEPIEPLCQNNGLYTLVGIPAGGNFSGDGVTGSSFDPSVVGVGTWTITYTYTDENGCTNFATQSITVLPTPSITFNPENVTTQEASNATFHVEATDATAYLWQISTDNGFTWTDLENNASFSGVFTADLVVSNVPYSMNGNLFHCVVSGLCEPSATSQNAELTVIPFVRTIAGTVTSCAGQIIVPVSVEHLFDVASMSLSLNYDNTVLTYSGYQNVNPELSNGFYDVDAYNGQVKIAYFSIVPANIGTGLVMDIIFQSTGGYSALTWDTQTYGNCEYHNINGDPIFSLYIDGEVFVNPLPTVSLSASSSTLCVGQNSELTFNLTGSSPWNISWTETTDGNITSHSAEVTTSTWSYSVAPTSTTVYTVTSLTDANGCTPSELGSITITVNPLPAAEVTLSASEVCAGTPVTTTVNFTAGVAPWTFNLLLNGISYPGTTNDNPFVVTQVANFTTVGNLISLTDGNGCSVNPNITYTVTVHPLPVVTLDALNAVCVDASSVTLNGLPVGGTYSGNGVTGNSFNPSIAGAGTWPITYTFTDENGCTNSATQTITVNALPVVTLDPVNVLCFDAQPVTLNGLPIGGTYSGTGVTGNVFNPMVAGLGDHLITYTYTNINGCTNYSTITITVTPAPIVTFDPIAPVCHNAQPITLTAIPTGGTYSGTGIVGNQFNPTLAGVGSWTITYTYTNVYGCTNSASQVITVNPTPNSYLVFGTGSYCAGTGGLVVGLSGSSVGVQYHLYYNGVPTGQVINGTGSIITFGPKTEPGNYTVVATYPGTGCSLLMSGTATITVNQNPSVYAGGYTITCKGTGVTLNATLTGGTGPFTYQWIPATGLSNPNILNPVASPNNTTFYTLIVTDANGCSDSDNGLVVINPTPVVNAGPDKTIYTGTSTVINASVTSGTAPFTYNWTPATGLNNANVLTPVASPSVTTNYILHVTDANGCSGNDAVVINVTNTPFGYDVSGVVTYDNLLSTPMTNTNVVLKSGGFVINSSTTDNAGNFIFPTTANGPYTTDASCTKTWGGVNSLDALKIARHFQNIEPLTGLKLKAGDVDGNSAVNANDALLVMMRSVHLTETFVVGDWLFEQTNIVVNNAPVIDNFKALCYGDVNGSYIPPARVNPSVSLAIKGEQNVNSMREFLLPINAGNNMTVSAASLAITLPSDNLQILDVIAGGKVTKGQLVFNRVDNILYIEWYSLTPVELTNNEPLFLLKVKSGIISSSDAFDFNITGASVLGTEQSEVISDAKLTMPKLVISVSQFNLSDNYPNPFSEITRVNYNLGENGQVNLTVFNYLGEVVSVPVNNYQNAGNYTVEIDGSKLPQGVYIYKLTVNGDTRTFEQSKRLVITR